MHPHPRTRKTIKWAGAVAVILLAGVWVASAWWYAKWTGSNDTRWRVTVALGLVCIAWEPKANPSIEYLEPGLRAGRLPHVPGQRGRLAHLQWGPTLYWHHRTARGMNLPLWMLTLPLLLTTAAAWRLDTLARRRARAGTRCPSCNYDLTGLPASAAACPECGACPRAPRLQPQRGAGE